MRLLIVDDDIDLRDVITTFFDSVDFNVVTASNGEEACALLNGCGFDAVLADVMTPRMTGLELAAHVRAHHADLPVFLMSGYGGDVAREAREVGVAGFFEKPVDLASMMLRIRQVTARARSA
jgi:DNA-binding NtrC family response regulator